MSWPPPPITVRAAQCMDDECSEPSVWRSDDGYPFCNWHGYLIYVNECALEECQPHSYHMWKVHDRPHGPI